MASTSTLDQSQMSFWPVTVTAGEAELKTAATETATESPESSSTSEGGAAAMRTAAPWVAGAAAAAAGLGLL